MGYIVVIIVFIAVLLSLIEDRIKKYRLFLYITLSIVLILLAALREVGIDPDSENYEYTFLHYDNPDALDKVEYTYLLFSRIINFFTNDVHALFLLYAFFGVGLKFIAIRKLSPFWFLPVVIYLSYYFVQHECMQIRTGVLSGILLLIIYYLGEGMRRKAFILLCIGTLFHYSALILLVLFLFSNKPMSNKQRITWAMFIPAAYAMYLLGFSLIFGGSFESIPYIGNKIALYQAATEKGMSVASINVFSPLQIFTIFLYYYILYFHDTIIEKNKYFPLMIKFFNLGIFSYVAFAFFPVVATRFSMLFQVVSIILYANIYYTFRPKWAGIAVIILIAMIHLNYSLPNIGLTFLWEV
jgi:hypothetical protein